MNRTLIQTAIVAVAADAAVMAAVYAATLVADARARRRTEALLVGAGAPARRRLNKTEQAELHELELAKAGKGELPSYFPAQAAYLDAAAGFNPDLLSGDRQFELRELPLRTLITEITHAKAMFRNARKAHTPRWGDATTSSVVDMWALHLAALKAEFHRRDAARKGLSDLERAMVDAAYQGVVDTRDEWPTYGTSEITELIDADAAGEDEDDPNHWSWDARACIHCDADAFRVDPDTAEYKCAGCRGRFMARPHDWSDDEWDTYRQRVSAETYVSFAD